MHLLPSTYYPVLAELSWLVLWEQFLHKKYGSFLRYRREITGNKDNSAATWFLCVRVFFFFFFLRQIGMTQYNLFFLVSWNLRKKKVLFHWVCKNTHAGTRFLMRWRLYLSNRPYVPVYTASFWHLLVFTVCTTLRMPLGLWWNCVSNSHFYLFKRLKKLKGIN